jgi:hypothetical protein
MKFILYYLSSLIFIAVIAGFLLSQNGSTMSTNQALAISGALLLHALAISLIGGKVTADETEANYRSIASRAGMIAGTIILTIGIIYQLFVTHTIDYWLLVGLIGINLVQLVTLIYLNFKKQPV